MKRVNGRLGLGEGNLLLGGGSGRRLRDQACRGSGNMLCQNFIIIVCTCPTAFDETVLCSLGVSDGSGWAAEGLEKADTMHPIGSPTFSSHSYASLT